MGPHGRKTRTNPLENTAIIPSRREMRVSSFVAGVYNAGQHSRKAHGGGSECSDRQA